MGYFFAADEGAKGEKSCLFNLDPWVTRGVREHPSVVLYS